MKEELDPLMPVTGVDFLRIPLLLVIVGFIGNVNDLIKEGGAELRTTLSLGGRFVGLHLTTADDALLDQPLGGALHGCQHLLLFLLGQALVQVTAPLILGLAQLTILSNDLFALFSTPNLVIELLLLVALVLDELNDHRLALLEL